MTKRRFRFRFSVDDEFNGHVTELVIEAEDEAQARRFADAWMFARRNAELTLMEER